MSNRLYGHRWRKERKNFLLSHPLCVYCLEMGCVKQANVVDHIIPHKNNNDLFWDINNWQALCKLCHDSVKQKEEITGKRIGFKLDGTPNAGW